jgi:hypothetical protein
VVLLSAPRAASYAGVGYLQALGLQVGRPIVTDCGDDAGLVLAGLRAGLRHLLFTGPADTLLRLQDMAAQLGADVQPGVDLPILHLGFGEDATRAFERRGAL